MTSKNSNKKTLDKLKETISALNNNNIYVFKDILIDNFAECFDLRVLNDFSEVQDADGWDDYIKSNFDENMAHLPGMPFSWKKLHAIVQQFENIIHSEHLKTLKEKLHNHALKEEQAQLAFQDAHNTMELYYLLENKTNKELLVFIIKNYYLPLFKKNVWVELGNKLELSLQPSLTSEENLILQYIRCFECDLDIVKTKFFDFFEKQTKLNEWQQIHQHMRTCSHLKCIPINDDDFPLPQNTFAKDLLSVRDKIIETIIYSHGKKDKHEEVRNITSRELFYFVKNSPMKKSSRSDEISTNKKDMTNFDADELYIVLTTLHSLKEKFPITFHIYYNTCACCWRPVPAQFMGNAENCTCQFHNRHPKSPVKEMKTEYERANIIKKAHTLSPYIKNVAVAYENICESDFEQGISTIKRRLNNYKKILEELNA